MSAQTNISRLNTQEGPQLTLVTSDPNAETLLGTGPSSTDVRAAIAAAEARQGVSVEGSMDAAAQPVPVTKSFWRSLALAALGALLFTVIGGMLLMLLVGGSAVVGTAAGVGGFMWMNAGEGAAVETAAVADAADPVVPVAGAEGEEAAADTPDSPAAPAAEKKAEAAPAEQTPVVDPAAGKVAPVAPAAPVKKRVKAKPAAKAPVAPVVMPPPAMVSVKIITSPPAASIWIDGQNVGRSPMKISIPAGSHSLKVQSGRASGTYPIDAGLGSNRFCFTAKGKKLTPGC